MNKTPTVKPWIVRRWWFVLLILMVLVCLAYFGSLYPDMDFRQY